jgi:hypothetical protein
VTGRGLKIKDSPKTSAQPLSTSDASGEALLGISVGGRRTLLALARLLARRAARGFNSQES